MYRGAGLATSFRGRFLLVVIFAAVVPLALIGVWLTRSVGRAGEGLLRSVLDRSLQEVTDVVERRWVYRSGELVMLANNAVAQRLLAGGAAQPLAGPDSQYLAELFATLAPVIPTFEYRDLSGGVRWSTPPPPMDSADARRPIAVAPEQSSTMTLELPVPSLPGSTPVGTMIARVSVPALVSTDTSLRLPNGASLQMVERDKRRSLLSSVVPDSLLSQERFTARGHHWIAIHRSLAAPAVDLTLAAPLAAYVQPFERAARNGMLTLAVVSLLALALSAFLTTRLTRSLKQLAIAADAVAGGDLDHRVDGRGRDEVGRVGAAFNSMAENLRRTLSELSRRQALAAVGEYAAALSHQVRNGLTAVRVDLQRAEEKIATDEPGRALVTRALENVKGLDGSVSKALRIARGSSAPKRRIDLRRTLRSATQGADSSFAERGASIVPIADDGAPVWVLGDTTALEQLFLNLLINAAQAMERGGKADITLDVLDSEVRVVITDNGHGIPPGEIDRVLEPFFSTKTNGTGLGLSIARQIAGAHGGSLRIESVPDRETRVEVRLPLAAAPQMVRVID